MDKKKSFVWNHFTDLKNGKGKCGYCSTAISFKGGSTANFIRHLKTKHPGIEVTQQNSETTPEAPTEKSDVDEIEIVPPNSTIKNQKQQPSVLSYFNRNKPMTLNKTKQIDEQLVRMVVKEYQPFSIVEDSEFTKLLQLLNHTYVLPGRKKLTSSLLPQAYQKTLEKVKQDLDSVCAVSITTDAWTSINNESYIAVTTHFIDDNMQLKSYFLECVEFTGRHTADNLHVDLKRVFKEWKIEDKIVAVVSDNAFNIKAAVRLGKWRHINCFAYSLNLIVQNAIRDVELIKIKVKTIVEHFKRSTAALNKLKTIQTQLGFLTRN